MKYINYEKYSTSEIKKLIKNIPNNNLGIDLKNLLNKIILYRSIPNVFLLDSTTPNKRLGVKNIHNCYNPCDYVCSYLVRNKNGLNRLIKIFDIKVMVYEYPIIIDIYYNHRSGDYAGEIIGSKDGFIIDDKYKMVYEYFTKRSKRDIYTEINDSDKFIIKGYTKFYRTEYDIYYNPINKLRPYLVLEKKINGRTFSYLLDIDLTLTSIKNNDESYVKVNLGEIVLSKGGVIEGNKILLNKIKYKKIPKLDKKAKEVFKEFKETAELNL